VVKEHTFEGIIPNLERRYAKPTRGGARGTGQITAPPVPARCHGARLRTEARYVIGERNLSEVSHLPLAQCKAFFDALALTGQRAEIADKSSARSPRLQFLNNVGLDYLSLDRSADTLSGGEAQRIRLASQIGSGLTGVMYVLDEPSIGLHQRDNDRLIDTLRACATSATRDRGGARRRRHPAGRLRGRHGPRRRRAWRRVIAEGRPQDIAAHPDSLTGAYLSGTRASPCPSAAPSTGESLRIAAPAATTSRT
jgi:excinuclease ABC subunit A